MKHAIAFFLLITSAAKAEDIESRLPFSTLQERSIAYVRRPALVEWRKSSIIIDLDIGQPLEYHNFNSKSYGLGLRFPDESFVFKTAFALIQVQETKSSRQLAKTPFEQEGRPTRLEWQNGMEFPIIEGIGQQLFTWVPPAEFVLSAVADINFYIYPDVSHDPLQVLKNLAKLQMSETDRQILESKAPSAMHVHNSLHSLDVGLLWDNYYKSGVHWNMRFLYGIPAGGGGGELKAWYSFSFGVGYAL